MQKETIIAKVRGEISLSDEGREYIRHLEDSWIAESEGDVFLQEFGGHWNSIFTDYGQNLFEEHFRELDLSTERRPQFKVVDSHRGSWIMEAALTMLGSVGSVYIVLKGISELPQIADGLEELKSRLTKEMSETFQKEVRKKIEPTLGNIDNVSKIPKPPKNLVACNFSIDARPLRSLSPDKLQDHKIHLSTGISRSVFVLENLGEDELRDLNIGLFKSDSQRHQWSFEDAYSKTVSLLSPKQSTSVDVAEFKDIHGKPLEINDSPPAYIDCWVQDQNGIFLFNFLIDE